MGLLVYITCPDEDAALEIAGQLVLKHLAAGVNVLCGAHSVYRWRGKVRRARECLLLAQVSENAYAALEAEVKSLHVHEVPCIIAVPIVAGHEPFLEWIGQNSTGGPACA